MRIARTGYRYEEEKEIAVIIKRLAAFIECRKKRRGVFLRTNEEYVAKATEQALKQLGISTPLDPDFFAYACLIADGMICDDALHLN